jgi:hypothetical protein
MYGFFFAIFEIIMALTKSLGSSIFSPEGNSLAVFIDVTDNVMKVKDVFGYVQILSTALGIVSDVVDVLTFNTSYVYGSLDSGQLAWNDTEKTVDLRMGNGGGNISHLGQSMTYPLIVNKSNTNLIAGTLVMVDPTNVAQGNRLRVVKAVSNGTYPATLIVGVLSEAIPNNQEGFATWFGYVRDLSLTALKPSGETWVEGNILYPNPTIAGGLTNIRPEAPNLDSTIAAITRITGNTFTLLVRPQLGFTVGELNDVKDASSTAGQVLMKQASGIWENKDIYGTPVVSVSTPSTHKIPVTIGGVTYYLLATNV